MSRITVDVPDSVLGETKAKELTSLRNKNKRLEARVKDLELERTEAKRAIKAFRELRTFLSGTFDLYEDYGF